MSFDPYLMFKGDCREALSFYKDVFGGDLYLMTYAEAPESPGMPKVDSDLVMHGCLTVAGRMLMASDFPPGMEGESQQAVSVSHGCPTREEAQAIFEKLAGEVIMPFGDVFWCDGFGMTRDRFGTHWLIGGPSKM
ncbi:VOC family protein [Cereibacter sp. SYSU M97828]|nr:VOC family protein [Cereibacter flavus]